ncbi:MAG: uroporphyrinogen decarboxylase family protein [Anaerolineae bacterium]
MDGRERFLTAISNQKPDRLPVQVHNWMRYYLDTYLDGCGPYEAYARFGMDPALYVGPTPSYKDEDLAKWQVSRKDLGTNASGEREYVKVVTTPEGELTERGASNAFTEWITEYLIKDEADLELFLKYALVPSSLDPTPVIEAQRRVGKHGIVRGWATGYGQGSPWQDFCMLVGTETAIFWAIDQPELMQHAMDGLLEKRLRFIELLEGTPLDLIETGGGAGSNTVISPRLFRRFCLPYDRTQHDALHAVGLKAVYHLCGGLMKMLDMVVETHADALETMTPPAMGGDCDLAEANRRVGDKLCFIGGFDQNAGFEQGTPEAVREQVRMLHACCPDGGYICSPSDHFFFGDPENVQAFADVAQECVYE